jgi:hypothetical protein
MHAYLLLLLFVLPFPARADVLALKAQTFREQLYARHLAPQGFVLYRVDLRTIDERLLTGEYPAYADTPTFTGIWAAAACSRAASTHGQQRELALQDARTALRGLVFLMDVTGVPGLMARSARRGPVPSDEPRRRWFAGGPGYEGWAWRGDVSMDQYANGLVPAVSLCHALFPEQTRHLIRSAAEHLLAHDMQLMDPDGRRTEYGDLGPRSGWGFNGLAMLTGWGVFALAAELDGDPRFEAQRDLLRDQRDVVSRGARRTNLRVMGITNTSNDLMAFQLFRALVPLARRTDDPALEDLLEGLRHAERRVRPYQNAYLDLVHCELLPDACRASVLDRVEALLEAFPSDKRKLPRPGLDEVPRRLLPGRKWKRQARHRVPIELRSVTSFEWKSSSFRVDSRVAPDIEYTGLDFIVAWWLWEELTQGPRALRSGATRVP